MVDGSWFRILRAACQLCGDGHTPFTAEMLAEKAGIQGSKDTKPSQSASAWLSKFLRWGYVSRERKAIRNPRGGRPKNSYLVTPKGLACRPTESRMSRLGRLIAAVRAYQKVRGTRSEAATLSALVRVCDEVDVVSEDKS